MCLHKEQKMSSKSEESPAEKSVKLIMMIENAKDNADLHACLYKPWTEEDLINTIKSGLNKLSLKK